MSVNAVVVRILHQALAVQGMGAASLNCTSGSGPPGLHVSISGAMLASIWAALLTNVSVSHPIPTPTHHGTPWLSSGSPWRLLGASSDGLGMCLFIDRMESASDEHIRRDIPTILDPLGRVVGHAKGPAVPISDRSSICSAPDLSPEELLDMW